MGGDGLIIPVINAKANKALAELNESSKEKERQIKTKHKVLIAGVEYQGNYYNPIAEDMHKIGFLTETCSLKSLVHNAKQWKDEVDVLFLASSYIPYYSTLEASELKTAVKTFKDSGVKIVWFFNHSVLRFEKRKANGYKGSEVSVSDLFPNLNFSAVNIFSEPYGVTGNVDRELNRRIIHEGLLVKTSTAPNFTSTDTDVQFPAIVTNGTVTANMVAFKKREYAIIGYGGIAPGDPSEVSAYRYVDYANLVLEL